MFFKGSRYATVGDDSITDSSGRVVRFKKIRFITAATPVQGHMVQQDERLDHIAHTYLDDPELSWRIADANSVLWPADLVTTAGRKIRIPSAEE